MTRKHAQRGSSLIEVLVAMLVVAFGMLGLVGLQARTAVTSLEGYQRTQALVLLGDIAQRINLNRANADAYVAEDIGAVEPGACPAAPAAQRDLCEWANLLRGAAEQQAGTKMGAMQAARGCIARIAARQYLVSVAWQGVQASGPSTVACGEGDYAQENLRRGVSVVVQIADLGAP